MDDGRLSERRDEGRSRSDDAVEKGQLVEVNGRLPRPSR